MITKKDVKLGRNIRKLRKLTSLTQEEVAERVGISTTYMGYIEIGQKKPSLKVINKIAEILKVKVRDLFPY
ncbi:MAG: hypothetical protein A2172_05370 [Candidatus Woykebacteria bacterium RBG_13_40_15]|uniref:HTH cro/C1-type domain-containing protein n=1 Tax=Candidatus Woykebacteria bacterium RBG_13_40_15 TaxID=1802593 RepID=A0A1G1W893_9BACT|nr:MAG: hypothetical protein A2172_05370 [Candidatus Woykebacteria bacterium RBG_13_40_15]